MPSKATARNINQNQISEYVVDRGPSEGGVTSLSEKSYYENVTLGNYLLCDI